MFSIPSSLHLVLLVGQARSAWMFTPAPPSFLGHHSLAAVSSSFDQQNSKGLDELDRARVAFEELLKEEHSVSYSSASAIPTTKEEYVPPPLTESSRKRRLIEMELLASLEDSDEAVDELMSLWLVERDADSAMQLQAMESECSAGLVEEEAALRGMVEAYGIDWAEPVSRLAGLLYFKGETEDSEYWCRVALAVKPWHFEIMQTLVLNALRRQDLSNALQWRRKALPPLNEANENRRRKEWVQNALQDAQESLQKAQEEARSLHNHNDSCEDFSSEECELWQ